MRLGFFFLLLAKWCWWNLALPWKENLVWVAARSFRVQGCYSEPLEHSELRIQHQVSAWRAARKLQTLGKCSSTNLYSFTFRPLTQKTEGIFLRFASPTLILILILSKNEWNDKRKYFSNESIIIKINYPKKMLKNDTNISHQH